MYAVFRFPKGNNSLFSNIRGLIRQKLYGFIPDNVKGFVGITSDVNMDCSLVLNQYGLKVPESNQMGATSHVICIISLKNGNIGSDKYHFEAPTFYRPDMKLLNFMIVSFLNDHWDSKQISIRLNKEEILFVLTMTHTLYALIPVEIV